MSRRRTRRDQASEPQGVALLGALSWEGAWFRSPVLPACTGALAGFPKPCLHVVAGTGVPWEAHHRGTMFSTASLSHLARSPSLIGQQPVPLVPEVATAPCVTLGEMSVQLVCCLEKVGSWWLAPGPQNPGGSRTAPTPHPGPGCAGARLLLSAAGTWKPTQASSPPARGV